MTLSFTQIYFKEEQKAQLYDFATPYENTSLSHYFENAVIREVVPMQSADYIGVASWRLKAKRNDGSTPILLQHKLELSEEKILSQDFDVAVLTPRKPTHKVLQNARMWHPLIWDEAFGVFKSFLRSDCGIKVPDELTHAIYENHFIARREIYHSYVKECLGPAIDFMEGKELFLKDSGYANKKPANERLAYQNLTGRKDWPIAPFILERLFSIYIERKNLNVIAI